MIIIKSTKEIAVNHGVKAVIYGPTGVGKTTLASTAPKPFIVSGEFGLLSLKNFDIPATEIKTEVDLISVYNWLSTSPEAKQYHTIIVDGISEIAEILLAEEKAKHKDARQAYGATQEKMMKIIRSFRDLSQKHVFFMAKEEFYEDSITRAVKYQPSFPGKQLVKDIPPLFDEVFYMGVGNDPATGKSFRYLLTDLTESVKAKDRSGALDLYESPNLSHIINKILTN